MPCNTSRTTNGIHAFEWRLKGVPLKDQVLRFASPEIEAHYQRTFGLTAEAAAELFADVKKFVFVASMSGFTPYAPPPGLDPGWHEFILHTDYYATFCNMVGEFVHHNPGLSPHPRDAEAMELARKKAAEIFGHLSSNWDPNPAQAAA
jgi:hypothetical protein